MLSMPRLVRLAETGQFDRLLEETLRNGRPLPLAARLRLSAPESIAASAISLALSRMTELTHRPTEGSQLLAGMLLAHQEADGSFGSPAVTASAMEALLALLEQNRYVAVGLDQGFRERLEKECDQGLHALYSSWASTESVSAAEGLFTDALETALMIWRLGSRAMFDAMIGVGRLRRAVAEAQARVASSDVETVLALTPCPVLAPLAA